MTRSEKLAIIARILMSEFPGLLELQAVNIAYRLLEVLDDRT